MIPPPRTPPSPPTLAIADAGGDDRPWAASVMAGTEPWITLGRTYDACLAICLDPDNRVLVARDGGERLGFIIVQRRGLAGSPYIATLAVAAEARSRGVGAQLIAHVESELRGQARFLFLCVSSFNARAQQFYARLGFEQVGRFPGYVIAGADELLLCKRLTSE